MRLLGGRFPHFMISSFADGGSENCFPGWDETTFPIFRFFSLSLRERSTDGADKGQFSDRRLTCCSLHCADKERSRRATMQSSRDEAPLNPRLHLVRCYWMNIVRSPPPRENPETPQHIPAKTWPRLERYYTSWKQVWILSPYGPESAGRHLNVIFLSAKHLGLANV